jgi:hypothetical protein
VACTVPEEPVEDAEEDEDSERLPPDPPLLPLDFVLLVPVPEDWLADEPDAAAELDEPPVVLAES